MNRNLNLKTTPVLLALSLAASAFAQSPGHGSEQLKKSMESGMQGKHWMPMSGDADKDFVMMMKEAAARR